MAFNIYEFKFPDVGEGITEGKLVEWKIGIGDNVTTDQPLCSIETDKAVVDIPSPVTGKVVELLNKVDDTLIVGNIIITIDVGNTEKIIPQSNQEHENQKIEVKNPNEKEISNGNKSYKIEGLEEIGSPLIKSEENLELAKDNLEEKSLDMSDNNNIKAMLSVRKYAKDNNIDLINISPSGNHGQIIIEDLTNSIKEEKILSPNELSSVKQEKEDDKKVEKQNTIIDTNKDSLEHYQDNIRDIISSPSVRQSALEKNIDINNIKGSGKNGRIELVDLEDIPDKKEIKIKSKSTNNNDIVKNIEETQDDKGKSNQPDDITIDNHHLNQKKESQTLPYDISMPYDSVRQVIADKMVDSLQKTAQLTIFNKICIDDLVNLRKKEKEILAKKGIKLTYIPFFVKAFIAAAKEYPTFNAISTENSTIIKSDFNIGIAMDTPRGLLVPNIFEAQKKSIVQIAKDIMAMVDKADNSKISLEDMSNGTFTITSLGAKGGQYFTPILNYPQTAILGIGEISKQPVVKNDEIVVGNVLHLSLTFDHRTVDGADAAKFFNIICELLKDIDLLLIEA